MLSQQEQTVVQIASDAYVAAYQARDGCSETEVIHQYDY